MIKEAGYAKEVRQIKIWKINFKFYKLSINIIKMLIIFCYIFVNGEVNYYMSKRIKSFNKKVIIDKIWIN